MPDLINNTSVFTDGDFCKLLSWLEAHKANKWNARIFSVCNNFRNEVLKNLEAKDVLIDSLENLLYAKESKESKSKLRNDVTGSHCGYFSSNYKI